MRDSLSRTLNTTDIIQVMVMMMMMKMMMIYIYYDAVSVCLSRKIITSELSAGGAKRDVR